MAFRTQTDSWIGLTKERKNDLCKDHDFTCHRQGWTWLDDRALTFSNWHNMEPTGESFCVRMKEDGTWADRQCNTLNMFVCEKTAAATPLTTSLTTTAHTLTTLSITTLAQATESMRGIMCCILMTHVILLRYIYSIFCVTLSLFFVQR